MRAFAVLLIAFFFLAVLVLLSSVLGIVPDSVALLWAPFRVHQETVIVHNSQGYVDAQNDQLRNLQTAYLSADAAPAQRAAIVAQMRGIAGHLRPGDLPDDLRAFLATH